MTPLKFFLQKPPTASKKNFLKTLKYEKKKFSNRKKNSQKKNYENNKKLILYFTLFRTIDFNYINFMIYIIMFKIQISSKILIFIYYILYFLDMCSPLNF